MIHANKNMSPAQPPAFNRSWPMAVVLVTGVVSITVLIVMMWR